MIVTQELTVEDVIKAAAQKALCAAGKEGAEFVAYGELITIRDIRDMGGKAELDDVVLTAEIDIDLEE